MGSIFILFLFQAIVTYADPKVQIDDTVKDCTPKELVVAQGKCSKYVNDLIVLTEEGDTKSRNVTDACKSVTVMLQPGSVLELFEFYLELFWRNSVCRSREK